MFLGRQRNVVDSNSFSANVYSLCVLSSYNGSTSIFNASMAVKKKNVHTDQKERCFILESFTVINENVNF